MKNEQIAYLAFTGRGLELAKQLSRQTGGTVSDGREEGFSLAEWTKQTFSTCRALVFIGAAGICVRAIAPFLKSKAEDPAVLCLDEAGRFVIPLLSGHLGGANALARELAAICGGIPVITTATDVNRVFAVDLWAKAQNLAIINPQRIKSVSAKILAGDSVVIACPRLIAGDPPKQVSQGAEGDAAVTFRRVPEEVLALVPRTAVLGIGCRKEISAQQIEDAFHLFCEESGLYPQCITVVSTIDRKATEPGLLSFCEAHGWPLCSYSAEELSALPGAYSASDFVRQTVGVDNVCERAAVCCSGGELIESKFACSGVTFAVASVRPVLNWRT